MSSNNVILDRVAEALLMDYTSIYYVNIRTNEYWWYSFDEASHSLRLEEQGRDFFVNMAERSEKTVYEEDRHIFTEDFSKDKMLELLEAEENGGMHSIVYRLLIDGEPVYHRMRLIREEMEDADYLILGVLNIDEDVREEQTTQRLENERKVFNQIAEGLASRYEIIYYIDLIDGIYTQFSSGQVYGNVEINQEGNDFFAEARQNVKQIIHPEDQERVNGFLDKDYLISKLDERREYTTDYRLMIDGREHHARLHVMYAADSRHIIIGMENIDDEVLREREQVRALKIANDMARRDELTGVKNKNAFQEFQRALQRNISKGKIVPFAVVMFDLNDLKEINDTRGHRTGDEYLIRACRMICKNFDHSPVFRIGGDEFAAVLMHRDYIARDILFERFRQQAYEHLCTQDGPVVASGMSVHDPDRGQTVSAVVEEADAEMYKDKTRLKSGIIDRDGREQKVDRIIPEGRRKKLDQLFHALDLAAEETFVYICDMKFDYSRWSKDAVEHFGMPAEYLYDAGYIWENHIHPDDRGVYHAAMDGIFFGSSTSHDMQYRAANSEGAYEMCTCRGMVMLDRDGSPEYFCGTIRKHGAYTEIDSVTGLRNLYGYLEDIEKNLRQHQTMDIVMIGISRFSELNDVYGYHFGNRLLQKVGRYLLDNVGGKGMVYRLDGTKFAVIGNGFTERDIRKSYERFRAFFRDGFYMDDKYIILEMNAAYLQVDTFTIDQRTINACLTYAYGISKNEQRGDIVRFTSSMGRDRGRWIEKIQAIRASITRGFTGFFLVYQPVVDARTEKLRGAEALIRWRGEPYGLVPPDDFIPVLEKDSLFPNLGWWILHRAILDAKEMLEIDPDFVVNVNLAYTQIERPGFTDEVLSLLEKEDYPPDHLCLEITERCRLLDRDLLLNMVVTLRSKGIYVAMDDFGTGYSSIGILKDLPTDLVKIDRSFTGSIVSNEKDRAMIGKFSEVASIYDMAVCVEGVETEEMAEILREYPVQCLQGYLYSKPITFEELLEWEKERRM